jgi:hypothetical protein
MIPLEANTCFGTSLLFLARSRVAADDDGDDNLLSSTHVSQQQNKETEGAPSAGNDIISLTINGLLLFGEGDI